MNEHRRAILKVVLLTGLAGCNVLQNSETSQTDQSTEAHQETETTQNQQQDSPTQTSPLKTESPNDTEETTAKSPADFNRIWRRSLMGKPGPPAASDDVLAFPLLGAERNQMVAVDPDTGENSWIVDIPDANFRKSPLVDGELLYFSGHKRALAVDVFSGEAKWNAEPDGTGAFDAQPVLLSDRLLIPATNPNNPSAETTEEYERVYAFDPVTGEQYWSVDFETDISGLTISDDFAVVQLDSDEIIRLSESGDVVWRRVLPDRSTNRYPGATSNTVYANGTRLITALNPDDGSVRWQSDLDGDILAVVQDGVIYDTYGGGETTISKLNRATGTVIWETALRGTTKPDIGVIYDGVLYVSGTVPSDTGDTAKLFGIGADSGRIAASHVFGGEYVTQPVASDTGVYVGHGKSDSRYSVTKFEHL